MNSDASLALVAEFMTSFACETGLSPASENPRRYLWTDAFAVCNFLELFRRTGDSDYKRLALRLVDQVHWTLGRHRHDDVRTGWLSGLDEAEGKQHPTLGGLRIGKAMPERGPDDPFDENLEWDRDGQYYHYLTKWMHALNRVARVTADPVYARWAIELAGTAHARFTYVPATGGRKRMYWKMSIDLSRPLVPSMGQHDPLDGFITYQELRITAAEIAAEFQFPDLTKQIEDMATICEGKSWLTSDPLGIGGLLADACRVAQMMASHEFAQPGLLATLLDAALAGLEDFSRTGLLDYPAEFRLAFRELGLTIGLHALIRLPGIIEANTGRFAQSLPSRQSLEKLLRFTPLIGTLEQFWVEHSCSDAGSWLEHRDINTVMLATSLAPDGFLAL